MYDELLEKDKDRDKIEMLLPKMTEPKRNQVIRNKVSMKKGKLNLSSFWFLFSMVLM